MKKSEITIIQKGLKKYFFQDLYYRVLKTSWLNFLIGSALIYVLLNFIFALIYYFAAAEILNARADSIWDAFVFSFQTSSTLGYGYMVPKTDITHAIVILDTIMGIFYVAIMTGLAFSKFARPQAKILFTNNIILSVFDGIPTLMFRIANGRDNNIIDTSLNTSVLLPYTSKEGLQLRRSYPLKLVRDNNPVFSLTWTAMHQIDESSPLYGFSIEELKEQKATFFISMTGIDAILSQSIHANHRYLSDKMIKAQKFVDILTSKDKANTYEIDFNKFHEVQK